MIVYGKNVIKEAVFSKRPIFKVLIDEKSQDRQFIMFLKDKEIDFSRVSKGELNRLTNNAVHQGVIADIKAYEPVELEDVLDSKVVQRYIILDGIEDPHNLGAIMRTAEAVGLTGIIMSKRGQVPLNATVAKVSSGAIEHVPVILVSNLNQTIAQLKKQNILVVGADGATKHTYNDIPIDRSLAIVLGNEGSGIRQLVKQNCDMLVKIPMHGKINSLNVSVAAALLMYATLRE